MRDSAGVEIVENSTPAWSDDEAWTVAPEPDLRLGTATGGGPEQFGEVRDAARLSDGRIAVADGQAQEVRVFSPDGQHEATLGGEGGGPGEFSQVGGLAVAPGDTILVREAQGGTLAVFGPDGEFVREVRPEGGASGYGRQVRGAFSDGTFVMSRGVDFEERGGGPSGIQRDTQPEFRIGGDGSILDTLGPFPGSESLASDGRLFFGRSTHYAVAGEQLYVGDDPRYEIRVYDPSGRLVQVVRKEHVTREVSDEDVERRRQEELRAVGDMDAPGQMKKALERSVREGEARETLPAFDGLLATADGHLWVQEARRPGEEPPRWSVFDPDGRWLGVVETPAGLEVERMYRDAVLGVREDDLGVQRVEVHRVRRP